MWNDPGDRRAARHIIITGGSSGIGEALARIYIARGACVSLIARNPERLGAARDRLTSADASDRLGAFSADVSDADALSSAVGEAEARFGPCDLMIASAGIAHPGYFSDLSPSIFSEQMATNFFGSVNAARAVFPGMAERRGGTILFVSSAAALAGLFGYTAYGSSKFAVTGFAGALRAEGRPHGVRVAICFPGDIDTPQLAAEEALKPPESKAITRAAGVMDADRLAAIVVRGLDRGRFAIYPNLTIALLARFGGAVRPALDRWLDWKADRAARQASKIGPNSTR